MQNNSSIIVRFEFLPKYAPLNAMASSESMHFNEIVKAREWVAERYVYHKINSKWFKIYNGKDECVFSSNMMRL